MQGLAVVIETTSSTTPTKHMLCHPFIISHFWFWGIIPSPEYLFFLPFVFDTVGKCMFNFVIAYRLRRNSKALYQLLGRHEEEPLSQEQVSPIFDDEEQSFYNWTITILNHATGDDVKHNMFERTVITHRRGLIREWVWNAYLARIADRRETFMTPLWLPSSDN